MLLMRSLNLDSKMKNDRLLEILNNLKVIVRDLESEIKSNPDSYTLNIPYEDVVKYYSNNNDDDEEGL